MNNNYHISKCIFKDVHPYNTSNEFQELCNQSFNHIILLLSFAPIIYILLLYIEKKCSKNKYKTL